ncbi:apolipoprotein N-acyltransferase [[Pseudopropionibacterium] massiliense]|uniref:apolipoprotein N-acyltransferase n=1 Tax=[Pseudopropionibacterium] massiliense TaxID=2220000 RepID=UPI0010309CB2|nr:apolipoprotein N-acyltransferase [[Pseudopropionibacterium] massiliense]
MQALSRARITWPLSLLLALFAGLGLALGFAPWGMWPLTIIGVGLLTWLVASRGPWAGFGLGMTAGCVLYGVTIWWVGAQAGPVVWVLVAVMAIWVGLIGAFSSFITRLPGWCFLVPFSWGATEYAAGRIPFGGFPWLRLGYTAIDHPLAGWLPWVGTAGATWLVAMVGCCCLAVIVQPRRLVPLLSVPGVFIIGGGMLLLPTDRGGEGISVGMVQGNAQLGLHGGYISATGATPHHLSETIFLLADARAHGRTLDMIVWAENSTDTDPMLNPTTRAQVNAAVELAQVPLDLGAITAGPEPRTRRTTTLIWVPEKEIVDHYHKRNLAPFGEFVPYRDVLEPLFPDVKRAGYQSIPGTDPGVVTVPTPADPDLKVGTVICYELAYDQTVYDTVANGAEIMVAQSTTHNFSGTIEPQQQMHMNRVRAAELGREFVASTLNGYSGFIDARGGVHEPTREYTAAHRFYTLPARNNITLAVHLAPILGPTHVLGCLLATGFGFRTTRDTRRAATLDGCPQPRTNRRSND